MHSKTDWFSRVIPRRGTHTYKWDFKTENESGTPLLPMWVADMDFPVAPVITDALRDRLDHPFFGYSYPSEGFFESFRGWHASRHGWEIQREWQVFAPGVMEAVRATVLQFSEPGDEAIIQPPVYYPFFGSVTDNARTLVENPLVETDAGYEIDFDHLRSIISDRTRLLILCSPHNPVGRVWSGDELSQLAEIALSHSLIVISDEIHADIVRRQSTFTPFASLSSEVAARTVALHAPSKTFNIPGLASSQAVIADVELRKRFEAGMERLGMTLPNVLSVAASIAAYEGGEPWVDGLVTFLDEQFDWFEAQLAARVPEISFRKPDGTYLAWLDFRSLMQETGADHSSVRRALFEDAALWLNSGTMFGKEGEGFHRLNLACPRATLEEGLLRLGAARDALKQRTGGDR